MDLYKWGGIHTFQTKTYDWRMRMKSKKQPVMSPLEMQQATEGIMRELGAGIHRALDAYFPNSGFTLLVFQFNTPGICNYISNADRDSMIKALKETVKKLEAGEDIPPAGSAVH